MFDIETIRKDFPILNRKVHDKTLVYLDNTSTTQKPNAVIDCLDKYYKHYNANIHRGIHMLSEEATQAYEDSRITISNFIDAKDAREVIFTRNTTEAINLVAYSWGRKNILPGDEIVISAMEHHSNFVPWQVLASEREAKLVIVELTADGSLDMDMARKAINSKTKLVAITLMSNVLGTITPIEELTKLAHAQGAVILVDGAQGVPHLPISVQKLDIDFLAFSLHKMLGPTGVGILWGKEALLEAMPPFLYGGDMISSVTRQKTTWNELPYKFEAGTPNIADVIASGAAVQYLQNLGMADIRAHEEELTAYALKKLQELDDITIYGPLDIKQRGGVISFNVTNIHPHDIGQILDESSIAIRAGHHCCQPLMKELKIQGTARASFYIYNTKSEVDLLVNALTQANKVMGNVAYR
jgi:cysteine desulfurase/selenocysteine lyase